MGRLARGVVEALERRDFAKIASIVANDGLDVPISSQQLDVPATLRRNELAACAYDHRVRYWGDDDEGKDVQAR